MEWVRGILDDRFGRKLYTGGLEIYTTLDLEMQADAQAAMEAGWERIEARPRVQPHDVRGVRGSQSGRADYRDIPYVQGMFVALDPSTGEVRAMIGGRDHVHSKFKPRHRRGAPGGFVLQAVRLHRGAGERDPANGGDHGCAGP